MANYNLFIISAFLLVIINNIETRNVTQKLANSTQKHSDLDVNRIMTEYSPLYDNKNNNFDSKRLVKSNSSSIKAQTLSSQPNLNSSESKHYYSGMPNTWQHIPTLYTSKRNAHFHPPQPVMDMLIGLPSNSNTQDDGGGGGEGASDFYDADLDQEEDNAPLDEDAEDDIDKDVDGEVKDGDGDDYVE